MILAGIECKTLICSWTSHYDNQIDSDTLEDRRNVDQNENFVVYIFAPSADIFVLRNSVFCGMFLQSLAFYMSGG